MELADPLVAPAYTEGYRERLMKLSSNIWLII